MKQYLSEHIEDNSDGHRTGDLDVGLQRMKRVSSDCASAAISVLAA